MITLENLKCPTCGADVAPPAPGATSVRCGYCGNEAMIHVPAPEAPRMRYPAAPRPVPELPQLPRFTPEERPRRSGATCLLVVLGIVLLPGAIIGLTVAHDCGIGNTSFQWRGVVIPVAINNDAVEDFVGVYASRREKDYPIYVAAFDGATQKELWRVGPFGKSTSELKLTVAGTSLVVTDPQPVAHIYALATGRETGKLTLNDKATETCVPPDTKGALWVETSDQRSVLIDLATATARPASRPASCPAARASHCDDIRSAAGCKDGEAAPKIDGFNPEFVLTQGSDSVAIGTRAPGTSTPMAVGLDAKTQTVRWQKPLVGSPPSAYEPRLHAVDMGGGRLVAEYVANEKHAGRLMALDVRSGNVLWDVAVPNTDDVAEAERMAVTATRVYLPHWTWLDLFDAQTGAHQATLGAW